MTCLALALARAIDSWSGCSVAVSCSNDWKYCSYCASLWTYDTNTDCQHIPHCYHLHQLTALYTRNPVDALASCKASPHSRYCVNNKSQLTHRPSALNTHTTPLYCAALCTCQQQSIVDFVLHESTRQAMKLDHRWLAEHRHFSSLSSSITSLELSYLCYFLITTIKV